MSDEKYSVDDILNEVKTGRSVKSRKVNDSDINDILGKDDLGDLFTGVQKSDNSAGGKPDLSVTQILSDVSHESIARQRTEDEVAERRSRELAAAFDKRNSVPAQNDVSDEPFVARQLTEEQSEARLADDISYAAEVKRWEKRNKSADDDDTRTFEDTLTFGDTAELPGEDDDIEFHSAEDFVPTDTMQLRKMQKINDINQALLMADSEAAQPEAMGAGLNAMETRQKAEELIKGESKDTTDTLAVAGNDLKRIARGEEAVKEYHPTTRRKEPEAPASVDDVLFSATGIQNSALHVGETIVEALNKKISEEKKAAENPAKEPVTDETRVDIDPVEQIRQADEMAQKKKRKIANFILEGNDTEEIEPQAAPKADYDNYDDDEDDDEPVDINDENVIRDKLERSLKGLRGRLIILGALFAVTVFVTIVNLFNLNLGKLNTIISLRSSTENYLYTHLVIGILSFSACSSVISNGFMRLLKLRPDGDTLCAFAHTTAIIALIPYLAKYEYISLRYSQVYLCVSLGALIFNTISKIFTVRTAQKNFEFVFADRARYAVESSSDGTAQQLAKGTVSGIPTVTSMRKTEILCDFIVSTYCEDLSDRMYHKIVPISIIAAFGAGILAFFMPLSETEFVMNRVNWAVTVLTGIFAITASFTSSMAVTLPLYLSSRKSEKRGSAILGYEAAESLSETNAVLIETKTLFPANSVKISNICGYDKPRNRGEGKINIDEAIILAASLAMASDSVLSEAFFEMLNHKRELLKPVSGCVYENNLGVMGWIDRRRVLLGNRKHMMSHEISVPNSKKETAANVNNDEVIYLAVGGEVCLLFFVELHANPVVKRFAQDLSLADISLVIKTVDGMITPSELSHLFEIDARGIRVLPFENHEEFNQCTRFTSAASAAVCCTGSFPSFAASIFTARAICARAFLGTAIQVGGIALGILLAIIFTLFSNHLMFNTMIILLYNLGFAALSVGLPFIKRL
ncbi:MAG: hypothetical protein K2N06_03370 [Oscillospiraceae bacterium]|nr:hypothetical protein [Oscillospiraceae bacterium]